MNRLGVYDVDAAFDKMSLQTAEEFGLDAILEQLVRAADVEGVRRLIEVSTPEGYRVPAACLRAAQQTAYAFDNTGTSEPEVLGRTLVARSACYSDPMVVDHRRRAFDVLITLVVAADEEALCTRGLSAKFLAVFRVGANGRQLGRQHSRMACRTGARALISEAPRRQASRQKTPARGAHDDAPPLFAQGRPFIRTDPRVLLVRGHREKTAMCWSRVK